MKKTVLLFFCIITLISAGKSFSADKINAEDFSNNAVMNSTGMIDNYQPQSEIPFASIFSANDRRLDNGLNTGKWGGYSTTGGQDTFMGLPLYVGTVAMVRGADSLFGKSTNGDIGYLVMLSDTKNNGNETGSYFYTYFPDNAIDLSDNSARIEWDSCDKSSANTDLSVRLILCASGKWIRSSVVPVTVTNAWANAAVKSVQPNLLTWDEITSPPGINLTSLTPADEGPLEIGAAVTSTNLPNLLSDVDGFGMIIAVDLQGTMGMPLRGFYLDALHLRGKDVTASVRRWELY